MSEQILTLQSIKEIPDDRLPMLAFVDNPQGLFGFGIKKRTKGLYSHFMWLHRQGIFASQDWYFKAFPVDHYSDYTIKLVWNPSWSEQDRRILHDEIQARLDMPWWKTRYDGLAILGKALGWDWLQVPWMQICSDAACILRLVDPRFHLRHPDPSEVNAWTKLHPWAPGQRGYEVYGRYHAGD
jgi:hypothetical protein